MEQDRQWQYGNIFLSAAHDEDLFRLLKESGYDENEIRSFIDSVRERFVATEIDCGGIKAEIKKYFKRRPKIRKLMLDYRRKLSTWIEGQNNVPFVPQLAFMQLPPLNDQSLPHYLEVFEKKNKQVRKKFPKELGQKGLKVMQDYINSMSLEDMYSFSTAKNCEALLGEYINQSERNALKVFLIILGQHDESLIASYMDNLLGLCLKKLFKNDHFVRSLFNLLDGNFYSGQPAKAVDPIVMAAIISQIRDHNLIEPRQDTDVLLDKPREETDFTFAFTTDGQDGGIELNPDFAPAPFSIPAKYLPHHWNGHRLVNPNLYDPFVRLASALDQMGWDDTRQDKARQWMEGLANRRRYTTDFSRMKVNEMPGAENLDIWFYFFNHKRMEPVEIGIEVIVNGGSIVYFLNNQYQLEMRSSGNYVPLHPLPERQSSNDIDRLYSSERIRNWASPNAIRNLHYYILKHAHSLLVEPRSVEARSGNRSDPNENEFNIRLTEYSSEISIPSEPKGGERIGTRRRVTVYHGVKGHPMRLPEGKKASQKAIAEASRLGIHLNEGETYRKSHHRGSELAEEVEPKIKIKNH